MSLLSFFTNKKPTAGVARDRLQILLAHERTATGRSDLVALLREEILAVITKYVSIDKEKVQVKMDRGQSVSTIEIEVEIPVAAPVAIAV